MTSGCPSSRPCPVAAAALLLLSSVPLGCQPNGEPKASGAAPGSAARAAGSGAEASSADAGAATAVAPAAVSALTPPSPSASPSSSGAAALDPGAAAPTLEPAVCTSTGGTNLLTGLHPARSVDYLELVALYAPSNEYFQVALSAGVRCGGASDRAGCERALAALPAGLGFSPLEHAFQPLIRHHLRFTAGAQAGAAETFAEVRDLLVPIDTVNEALLLAFAADWDGPSCDQLARGAVKQVGGDYIFEGSRMVNDCPITTHHVRLRVAASGTVKVAADLGNRSSGACI